MEHEIRFGNVQHSSPQEGLRPEPQSPQRRRFNISRTSAIVMFSLATLFVLVIVALSQTQITTSAESPDGQYRAELVDRRIHTLDRNFQVRIIDSMGNAQVVIRSPDENPLNIGQERFLWSRDGERLLLLGRGFWVRKGAELANGESLYFLWDASSGKTWCNSDQRGPPFDITELDGYDFGETLELKSVEEQSTPQ